MLDIWNNHLDPEICREIIRRFEEDESHQYQGHVVASGGYTRADHTKKKCTEMQISMHDHWSDIDEIMFERFADAVQKTRDKHPGLAYMGGTFQDEGYRIKRYMPDGTEQFKFHIDVNGYPQAHRQLVCQWYLNTVKEGGETVFYEQGVDVQPVEGRLVTFHPFWTHCHSAKPPISEPKYIISGWLTFEKVAGPREIKKVIDHASRRRSS